MKVKLLPTKPVDCISLIFNREFRFFGLKLAIKYTRMLSVFYQNSTAKNTSRRFTKVSEKRDVFFIIFIHNGCNFEAQSLYTPVAYL